MERESRSNLTDRFGSSRALAVVIRFVADEVEAGFENQDLQDLQDISNLAEIQKFEHKGQIGVRDRRLRVLDCRAKDTLEV